MKISELITLLQQKLIQHGDRTVMTTWEFAFREVERQNVYLGNELEAESVLLIDADQNNYKDRIAADPAEGQPDCLRCGAKGATWKIGPGQDGEERWLCDVCEKDWGI